MRDCVSGEVVEVLEYEVAEAEREVRVGLNAVLRERMVKEGVRRGWKEPEKRLLRVDIVMVGRNFQCVQVESVVDVSWRLLCLEQLQDR